MKRMLFLQIKNIDTIIGHNDPITCTDKEDKINACQISLENISTMQSLHIYKADKKMHGKSAYKILVLFNFKEKIRMLQKNHDKSA